MALSDAVGADIETGGAWDPWGLSKISEQTMLFPHLQWLQESEIKHGRIAMLATVGVVVTQMGITLPGYPVQTADWTQALPLLISQNPLGFVQIVLFLSLIEGQTFPEGTWMGKAPTKIPGEFLTDAKDMKNARLQEIKNGRAAMIGMAAFAAHVLLPGSVPLYSALGL